MPSSSPSPTFGGRRKVSVPLSHGTWERALGEGTVNMGNDIIRFQQNFIVPKADNLKTMIFQRFCAHLIIVLSILVLATIKFDN